MLSRSVFQAAYWPEQFVTIICQRSGMFLAKFDQELVGKKTEWFKVKRLAINRWFVDARVAISAREIETKFISLTSKVKNICASTPTELTQIVLSIILVLVDGTLAAQSPSQALPNKYFIHLSQDVCARSTHSEQKTAQTETQTAWKQMRTPPGGWCLFQAAWSKRSTGPEKYKNATECNKNKSMQFSPMCAAIIKLQMQVTQRFAKLKISAV